MIETRKIVQFLKSGKIGVMPTDTIYGIVGSAQNPETVERIYTLRKRNVNKPMIILISSLKDLKKFNIELTEKQNDFLKKIWPNPVSVILPCKDEKFKYLHRGKGSLALRMPKDNKLHELLKQTGPLVAPSANFEGDEPSQNILQAKKYFEERVAFYVDGGEIKSKPSTILELKDSGSFILLRQGSFRLPKE